MLSLFAEHTTLRERISEYILRRGGVPRRDKLAGILREVLGVPVDAALLSGYLERYAAALAHELAATSLVEGVASFIRRCGGPLYVSSSAPEAEVRDQLGRRGLHAHFAAVYGGDTPKADALREIVRRHPGAETVFFGDSIGDWEAAREAGVAFVAVVSERDNFPAQGVTKLVDFAVPARIEAALQAALHERATRPAG